MSTLDVLVAVAVAVAVAIVDSPEDELLSEEPEPDETLPIAGGNFGS